MAGEGVQLLQVRVREREDLGEEGVEPRVLAQAAPKLRPLIPVEVVEAGHGVGERGVQPVLGAVAAEVDLGEGVHLRLGIDIEAEQLALEVVQEVGVRRLRQKRRLVVGPRTPRGCARPRSRSRGPPSPPCRGASG